jgi:hypothetical protein
MGKPYFRQVPSFQYVSRKKGEKNLSEYIPVKNLFKRGKLREDIFGNLVFFEKYTIIGDDRPYNVAYKFYGNETLDWVVLLSNNILNIQTEWPLSQRAFDKTMLEKYGSYETLYSGIHHYETREIKNSLGITVIKSGIKMQPTWKTNGNFLEITNSKVQNIYSGDGVTASTEVTVELKTPILRLSRGKQIYIKNVSAERYNGYQTISEIVESDETLGVSKFKYQISVASETASPTLSDKEDVLFVVSENSGLSGSSYYYEYWDDGLGYSVLVPSTSFIRAVTNYEYEVNVEEEKRNIYILKSDYLNVIFNDIDSLMTYKNGGVQYVNATMKRGDNIRLYE